MTANYKVVSPHEREQASPLAVMAGDRLHFERRTTKWAGWLWCWNEEASGWVPERWVCTSGSECVMRRDYRAYELTVEPGQSLKGILVESGWLLAVCPDDGVQGWVALDCLREEQRLGN